MNQVNQRPTPDPYDSFQRYLAAKVTVDDRALNRHVWARLAAALPAPEALGRPLRVLEVGAGIGTMVERFLAWLPPRDIAYTALDARPENIAEAQRRLPAWAAARGFAVAADLAQRTGLSGIEASAGQLPDARDRLTLKGAIAQPRLQQEGQREVLGRRAEIRWIAADLFDFARKPQAEYDLLIAHAFLDLMDVPSTLPRLFGLLEPGGLFYFTIVFDGVTTFEPTIDPAFDALVEAVYHRTMDERITAGNPSGDSRAGRHLFGHLAAAGATVLAAGASDWVVHPVAGGYPADEAYFLHFIVNTVATALAGHPELAAARFADWISLRHAQVESGELVYVAHQLDFLGQWPGRP